MTTPDESDSLLGASKAAIAEFHQRYDRINKREIIEQLAIACGIGDLLAAHWMEHSTSSPEAIAFFDACKLCFENNLHGYFLSGSVLEDWQSKDWRGKKGETPTPAMMFEHGLKVKGRLRREGDDARAQMQSAIAAGVAPKRISALDVPGAVPHIAGKAVEIHGFTAVSKMEITEANHRLHGALDAKPAAGEYDTGETLI